jgi:hypothetical protein
MSLLTRLLILPFCGLLLMACLSGCKDKPAAQKPAEKQSPAKSTPVSSESEYLRIKMELKLAQQKEIYLVFNLPRKQIELKLQGTIVWSNPLQLVGDNLAEFAEHFMGSEKRLVRPLYDKYLFSSVEKSSDSVLKIVSEVVRAKIDLMQRQVPERFQLIWDKDLILEVRTEIAGKPRPGFKNIIFQIRETLQRPFGGAILVIRMDSDHALTLYRAAERGLPTLIYPIQ